MQSTPEKAMSKEQRISLPWQDVFVVFLSWVVSIAVCWTLFEIHIDILRVSYQNNYSVDRANNVQWVELSKGKKIIEGSLNRDLSIIGILEHE